MLTRPHSLTQKPPTLRRYHVGMKFRLAWLALALSADALAASPKPTPEEARKFIDNAEQKLLILGTDSQRADWIKSTFITGDTEAVSALLDERAISATVDYAK